MFNMAFFFGTISRKRKIQPQTFFVFFISHIFFGERSVWKIFSLNSKIVAANKDYNKLINNKKNIITEINLLRDNNLDSDYITEISHDLLGLIQSDQIVIDIK